MAGGRGRGETIIIDFGKYLAKPDLIKYLTRTAPIASDGAADLRASPLPPALPVNG